MRMTLKLSQIRLYQNNPRLPESYNEKDALSKMVADQQKNLYYSLKISWNLD